MTGVGRNGRTSVALFSAALVAVSSDSPACEICFTAFYYHPGVNNCTEACRNDSSKY